MRGVQEQGIEHVFGYSGGAVLPRFHGRGAVLVEASGFTLGFLMCSFLRYAVSNRSPARTQTVDSLTDDDIAELWGIAITFILVAVALVWKVRPMVMAPGASRMTKLFLGIVIEFMAMTGSWLCFYGDQWEWWQVFAKGDALRVEKLKAANAVGVTEAATVLVVFIIIKLCNKSHWLLDVMLLNCGALCFGFGFESSIAATMADATSQSQWADKAWLDILIIVCLLIALLPPWWFYILPQAAIEDDGTMEPMDGSKGEEKAPPNADAQAEPNADAQAKPKDDAKEEPKAEEAKAEEAKAEEPKAEEAKAEEPKAEEAEEPKAEEPKAEEPNADAPAEEKADEPAEGEAAPAPDEKKEEAPATIA